MCGAAYAQSANSSTAAARFHYGIIKDYVTRAALKVPEGDYAFRPTPEVRSLAQLIGHLAYAAMTDASGTPIVKFDAGGEGSRVPIQMLRLTVLAFHTAHAFEHYTDNTYLRTAPGVCD